MSTPLNIEQGVFSDKKGVGDGKAAGDADAGEMVSGSLQSSSNIKGLQKKPSQSPKVRIPSLASEGLGVAADGAGKEEGRSKVVKEAKAALVDRQRQNSKRKRENSAVESAVSFTVPPGRLGLAVRCLGSGGAEVTKILPECSLGGEVEVGDFIVAIDGRVPKTPNDIANGNDRVRKFDVVKSKMKAEGHDAARIKEARKRFQKLEGGKATKLVVATEDDGGASGEDRHVAGDVIGGDALPPHCQVVARKTKDEDAQPSAEKRKRGRRPCPPGCADPRHNHRPMCPVEGCLRRQLPLGGHCAAHGGKKRQRKRDNAARRRCPPGMDGWELGPRRCTREGCEEAGEWRRGGACPLHGAVLKFCAVEGCRKWPIRLSLCNEHGDPKTHGCIVDGCTKTRCMPEGYCQRHGGLAGAAGAESRRNRIKGARAKRCTSEGCPNLAINGGRCIRHGAKYGKHRYCKVEGCANLRQREGVCIKHGARWRECTVEGCTRKIQKNGLCNRHGAHLGGEYRRHTAAGDGAVSAAARQSPQNAAREPSAEGSNDGRPEPSVNYDTEQLDGNIQAEGVCINGGNYSADHENVRECPTASAHSATSQDDQRQAPSPEEERAHAAKAGDKDGVENEAAESNILDLDGEKVAETSIANDQKMISNSRKEPGKPKEAMVANSPAGTDADGVGRPFSSKGSGDGPRRNGSTTLESATEEELQAELGTRRAAKSGLSDDGAEAHALRGDATGQMDLPCDDSEDKNVEAAKQIPARHSESAVDAQELPGYGFVRPLSGEVEGSSDDDLRRCTVEGCKRTAVDGLCRQHGGRQQKISCKVQGCGKWAQRGRCCHEHQDQITLCPHEGCNRYGLPTYCNYHHPSRPPPKHPRQKTPQWICRVEGCTNWRRSGGVCRLHRSHARYCERDGCWRALCCEEVGAAFCSIHRQSRPEKAGDETGMMKLPIRVRRTCSADGCSNQAIRAGVCVLHGARLKRCSHKGCDNRAVKGGVCMRHGAKQSICTHLGCANYAQKGGLCWRHGAKELLPKCEMEGCSTIAVRYGRCQRHGLRPATCSYEGCFNLAKSNDKGLCRKHTLDENVSGANISGTSGASASLGAGVEIANNPSEVLVD